MRVKAVIILISVILVILIIINGTSIIKKRDANYISLPSLPKPIAKEYAVITSAGQSTDVYIVNDIANKLMIHNYFMPQALEDDLEVAQSLVFVVGCSELGEKLHNTSYEEEKKRVVKLLNKANEEGLPVITVFIGGKQQLDMNTKELLTLIGPETDYLIGTKEANGDGFFLELSKNKRIPLTIINEVSDLSEPFASAFR